MAQKTAIPQEAIAPIEEMDPSPQCRHHWVIQTADGPVSPGVCQLCGEVREFKNYVEAGPWGNTRTSGRTSDGDTDTDTNEVVMTVSADSDEEEE